MPPFNMRHCLGRTGHDLQACITEHDNYPGPKFDFRYCLHKTEGNRGMCFWREHLFIVSFEGMVHNCDEDCFNNEGGFTCGCSSPGRELGGDGESCVGVWGCRGGEGRHLAWLLLCNIIV